MKTFLTVLVIVVLAGGWLVYDLLKDAGQFKKIEPHFEGSIQKVEGVVGAEDITVHRPSGLAFISSDDRRAGWSGKGALYLYDLNAEAPQPVELTRGFDQPFHPHGISLYQLDSVTVRLFVVNHRDAATTTVEIFDWASDSLSHRQTIAHDRLRFANDLAAVGARSFYVTSDHGNTSALGRTLEEYLRLARAYVLYYDGSQFTRVAGGIKYANGINLSADGREVYVAATTSGKIHVYDRDLETGTLTERTSLELGTGVDNIELDGEGNLWVGAHPKLLTFVEHAKDAQKPSPSQVLKITLFPNDTFQFQEVFLDDGTRLSGSSVAAVYGNKMLIGTVFDPHFLVCELGAMSQK